MKLCKNGSVSTIPGFGGELAGAWEYNKHLLLFKDGANKFVLYGGNKSVTLNSPVNDIAFHNNDLYVAVRENRLYVLDSDYLSVKKTIETNNPLYSIAKYGKSLLATDEEYRLEMISETGNVSDLGCINYSDGSVNTNAFEHIRSCADGIFYSSGSVCAKLKLKNGSVREQSRPAERFFNAVKEGDRQKVYDTFEGQYKECRADGVTYRIENRCTLVAYSENDSVISSIALDKSLSDTYILKPMGKNAVVLTKRAKKNVRFLPISVVRSVIAIYDGSSLIFRKEYEPNENITDVYVDGGKLWVRGSSYFYVIDCQNRFAEKKLAFDFYGFSPSSPAIVVNSLPILFKYSTSEICVFSGENGNQLASYPMSRTIDSIQRGQNEILCYVSERGTYTQKMSLEETQ